MEWVQEEPRVPGACEAAAQGHILARDLFSLGAPPFHSSDQPNGSARLAEQRSTGGGDEELMKTCACQVVGTQIY